MKTELNRIKVSTIYICSIFSVLVSLVRGLLVGTFIRLERTASAAAANNDYDDNDDDNDVVIQCSHCCNSCKRFYIH